MDSRPSGSVKGQAIDWPDLNGFHGNDKVLLFLSSGTFETIREALTHSRSERFCFCDSANWFTLREHLPTSLILESKLYNMACLYMS